MSLNSNNLPTAGGGNIEPMAPGTYPARTVCMVDLGMQVQPPFQGKEKPPVNKVAFTFEFVDEFLKDENDEDILDKPRWLTEIMAIYPLIAEKAKSTARYLALDPQNVHGGDFSKLVDVPCMVTVVHNPKQKGGVWENIGGVTAMRERDAKKCPPLVNKPLVFDMDTPDLEVFSALPQFLQKLIKEGLEYEGSKLYGMMGGEDTIPAEQLQAIDDNDSISDENPY